MKECSEKRSPEKRNSLTEQLRTVQLSDSTVSSSSPNALPTATLTPDIASTYGIVRSKYRGMLNVAVIKDVPGTTGQPVTATVKVKASNLLGKTRDVSMREVREGDAIYYIGEFPIHDRETLNFQLEVTPSDTQRPIKATLTQEFYID